MYLIQHLHTYTHSPVYIVLEQFVIEDDSNTIELNKRCEMKRYAIYMYYYYNAVALFMQVITFNVVARVDAKTCKFFFPLLFFSFLLILKFTNITQTLFHPFKIVCKHDVKML